MLDKCVIEITQSFRKCIIIFCLIFLFVLPDLNQSTLALIVDLRTRAQFLPLKLHACCFHMQIGRERLQRDKENIVSLCVYNNIILCLCTSSKIIFSLNFVMIPYICASRISYARKNPNSAVGAYASCLWKLRFVLSKLSNRFVRRLSAMVSVDRRMATVQAQKLPDCSEARSLHAKSR